MLRPLSSIAHPSDAALLRLMDGAGATERAHRLASHVEQCAACGDRMRALARLTSTVRELGEATASSVAREPVADRARLQAALRSARVEAPLAHNPGAVVAQSWWLPLAAALVVSVAATTYSALEHATARGPKHFDGATLPIAALTPGATRPITREALCTGAPQRLGSVPPALRQTVLANYRMEALSPAQYELDYLITPELGGAKDAGNLWPERYSSGVWNARVKDELEALLPRLVCAGTVDLPTAQRQISDNWIAAYQIYFHTDRPLRTYSMTAWKDDDDRFGPELLPAREPDGYGPNLFGSQLVAEFRH